MPARFVISHSPRKGYHWNLVATNGKVVATSEHYETRRAAMGGIASVQKNADRAEVIDKDDLPKKGAAKKGSAGRSGKKSSAAKSTGKKSAASKSTGKKSAAGKKSSAAKKSSPGRKSPPARSTAKKSGARTAPAGKATTAKRSTGGSSTARG